MAAPILLTMSQHPESPIGQWIKGIGMLGLCLWIGWTMYRDGRRK